MRAISNRSTAILAAALLSACGGGGGGGSVDTAPSLIAAAWVGTGASPAPGDSLWLTFDQAVTLVDGTRVDDADLRLSTGTLGSGSGAPAAISAFTVRVPLGAGVSFTPGSVTIAFLDEADAILGVDGKQPVIDAAVPVQAGDGTPPTIQQLTVEQIEDVLNGDGAPGGTLQVRRSGFTVDVTLAGSDQAGVFALTVDGPVIVDGVTRTAGDDLSDLLVRAPTGPGLRLEWPVGALLPLGDRTLTVVTTDGTGMPSQPANFTLRATDAIDALRPLERGQLWFLDLSRDVESFVVESGGGVARLRINAGANQIADLEDILEVLGLRSASPLGDVQNGRDSNAVVFDRIRETILTELGRLFEDVDITFTFDRPGTFPVDRIAVPYASFGFSQMCIAGSPVTGPFGSGTLGAALLDLRNESQEDNCQTAFVTSSGTIRLGVFAHTFVDVGLQSGASSEFRQTYRRFADVFGGTPIGEDPSDRERLTGAVTDLRAEAIDRAIVNTARILALVTAHECGHSMGLVANGPMPRGLYGGDPFNFPPGGGLPDTAAENHINSSALLPPGAQNVMSAAVDFDRAVSPLSTFNTLNLAYLRERVLYDER